MSQAGGSVSWSSMNENLMALLEAVLTLAASDAAASRRPSRPAVKAGGHSEEIFVDLTEEEQDEFSCSICYQVLKETMQCLNHHKFCHSCLYVWSTTGQYANRVRCPVCRCQGYYFRNDELDEKINKKKVKCSMEGCKWTGQLKYLGVHRHTNYGASTASRTPSYIQQDEESSDESEEEEDDRSDSTVLELPYLGRAAPNLPHRSTSRFTGTGLQARTLMTAGTAAVASEDSGNPTVLTTTTPLDRSTAAASTLLRQRRNAGVSTDPVSSTVGGGGGVLLRARREAATRNTESSVQPPRSLALLRERRNSNGASGGSEATAGGSGGGSLREQRNTGSNAEAGSGEGNAPTRLSVRQRVHPIRRGPVSRITVTHTDTNNNLAAPAPSSTPANNSNSSDTAAAASLLLPTESPLSTPRQPRPPSAPRPPNQATRRNLPGLSSQAGRPPRGNTDNQRSSSPPTHVIRAPPTFNAATASRATAHHSALNSFHDRLQESRDRLEGLMSNFSGELERSRQEMADFQLERERQRREQLTEVRELGRRLGQVATELRSLLNNRTRLSPSDSDD